MGMLEIGQKVATPAGWRSVATLACGDEVFDATGATTLVTTASPPHVVLGHAVMFDDLSRVVASAGQNWPVVRGRDNERCTLDTNSVTAQIFSSPTGRWPPARQLRVSNAGPLSLPDRQLPIHPYVLGAWLGDGRRRDGSISKADAALFWNIETCGYGVGKDISGRSDGCPTRTVFGLRTALRAAGLLDNKHVPDVYFRASFDQRLALLQGLMDTDGSWNRTRHQAVFTSTDPRLASAVAELVATLGAKARVWTLQRKGFGLTVTAYDVTFSPYGFNCFWIPRKAQLVRDARTRAKRRIVQGVGSMGPITARGITTASGGGLLVGAQLLPTGELRRQAP